MRGMTKLVGVACLGTGLSWVGTAIGCSCTDVCPIDPTFVQADRRDLAGLAKARTLWLAKLAAKLQPKAGQLLPSASVKSRP